MPAAAGIIAVVPDEWLDTVTTRHHVIRRLARHFPVVWLEPALPWQEYLLPGGHRFLARDRWHTPVTGVDVFTPGLRHPNFYRWRPLAHASFRSRLERARRRLLAQGSRRIILYLWRDEFAAALDLVHHDVSCYHIDDEYSFSPTEVPNSARELQLLRRVDQVIVHSPALIAKKGGINARTALVPNGVSFDTFADPRPEPADLADIPGPRVGYVGVVKKQLDLALLGRLAEARPATSFVIVGPVKNVTGKELELDRLRTLQNVHFLGERPPEELGAYMQHLDLCLMCYDVNDYTKYIYPLKLNEYLATGRPVVSAPIATVLALADLVTIARTDADWLAAIDAVRLNTIERPETIARRQEYARNQDWNTIVETIAQLFDEALARSVTPEQA